MRAGHLAATRRRGGRGRNWPVFPSAQLFSAPDAGLLARRLLLLLLYVNELVRRRGRRSSGAQPMFEAILVLVGTVVIAGAVTPIIKPLPGETR